MIQMYTTLHSDTLLIHIAPHPLISMHGIVIECVGKSHYIQPSLSCLGWTSLLTTTTRPTHLAKLEPSAVDFLVFAQPY